MLTGDFKKLGQLAENLRRLAEVPAEIAERAAPRLKELTEKQFDAGVNPYGRAWSPLKPSTLKKGRTPPPLTDTRAMRNSLQFIPLSDGGIGVTIDFPAVVHQMGSPKRNLDARQILPVGTFPRTWREVIETISRDLVRDTLRKVA